MLAQNQDRPTHVNLTEAAKILRVSWRTAKRWCDAGEFAGVWRKGTVVRIPVDSLDKFMADRQVTPCD